MLASLTDAELFKESLSEGTLCSLVTCARDYAAQAGDHRAAAGAALATQVLEGLSSTRRFALLLMFLDGKQKAVVKDVFKQLDRLGLPAPEQLKQAWEIA